MVRQRRSVVEVLDASMCSAAGGRPRGRCPRARPGRPGRRRHHHRQAGRRPSRSATQLADARHRRSSCWASSTTRPACSSTRCRPRSTTPPPGWSRPPTPSWPGAAHELADYAVAAYIKGGESDLPDILLKGSGPDVSRQIEYLQAASSSRRQLIDDVRAAQCHGRRRAERPASHPSPGRAAPGRPRRQAGGDEEGVRRAAGVAGQGQRRARHPGGRGPGPPGGRRRGRGQGPAGRPPGTDPDHRPPGQAPGTGHPADDAGAHQPRADLAGAHQPTGRPRRRSTPPQLTPVPWPVPPGKPPPVLPQAAAVVALAETQLGVALPVGR